MHRRRRRELGECIPAAEAVIDDLGYVAVPGGLGALLRTTPTGRRLLT